MAKKDFTRVPCTVFCCQGGHCTKHGAHDAFKALRHAVREAEIKDRVHFIKTECTGPCKHGPMVIVASSVGLVWYQGVKPRDAGAIVRQHLRDGQPVEAKRFLPHQEVPGS